MDIFDEVIDTAQKAGSFIYDKTGVAVSYVNLEYKKSVLRNKLNNLYTILGKLTYKSEVLGKDVGNKKELAVAKIKELSAELSEVSREMAKFKNVCPSCGKTNMPASEFCSKCGQPLK